MTERIKDAVLGAEMVLVGIGEEFSSNSKITEEDTANSQTEERHAASAKIQERKKAQEPQAAAALYETTLEDSRIIQAYNLLRELIGPRPYFAVTLNTDGLIHRSRLEPDLIVEPCREDGDEAQWSRYLKWLSCTLNHRLCILELGVGFTLPQLIRWPFEKTTFYNQKATLVRVNSRFPQTAREIQERSVSIQADPVEALLGITLANGNCSGYLNS